MEDQVRDPIAFFGERGIAADLILPDAAWLARSGIEHDPMVAGPHIVLGPVAIAGARPGDVIESRRSDSNGGPTTGSFPTAMNAAPGAGLYNDRDGTFRLAEQRFSAEEQALVDEFLGDMKRMQDRLVSTAGNVSARGHASDDPEVRALYLLLQVWDRLSLQYVFRLAGAGTIGPLPRPGAPPGELRCRRDGPFRLALDPYPFADDRLTFPVAAHVVADRDYRSPEDFLEAVADAPESILECQARAGPDSLDR